MKKIMEEKKNAENNVQKLQKEKDLERERYERSSKLLETKINTVSFQADARKEAEIDELRQSFENEKKNAFSVLLDNFQSYIDMKKPLNYDLFKDTIEMVGNDLKRLKNEDQKVRKLLGITPQESSGDAISNLLKSLYNLN